MRFTKYGLLVLAVLLVMSGGMARAHEVERSGTVSAVLHIEPDDNVVSNTPSQYEVEFDDSANMFKLSDCDCMFMLQHSGKTVSTVKLQAANENTAAGKLTFPTGGNYTVALMGTSKTSAFAPFQLNFPETIKSKTNPTLWVIVGVVAILVLLGGALGAARYGRRRSS